MDAALLYHCANTKMRHDVNKAVGARVKSNGEAFRQFTELVADPGFLAQLEEARKNPKGRDARQVLKRVVNSPRAVLGRAEELRFWPL